MKRKIILFVIVSICATTYSCNNKQYLKEFKFLTSDSANLTVGETTKILLESDGAVNYTSSYDFIASVDENGNIKANKVGETHITIKENQNSARAQDFLTFFVNVEPQYNLYDAPPSNWYGAESETFRYTYGEPDLIENNTWYYNSKNPNLERLGLIFNESNFLVSSFVVLNKKHKDILEKYLDERYNIVTPMTINGGKYSSPAKIVNGIVEEYHTEIDVNSEGDFIVVTYSCSKL